MYKVVLSFDFDPDGRHYVVGEVLPLKSWRKAQIQSALAKRLIEAVADEDGEKEEPCLDR
jgi:hypothetical protein